jgi:hypothetical protein
LRVVAAAGCGADARRFDGNELISYSAATCASFAATERFMKKTRPTSATAITAKMKKMSKYESGNSDGVAFRHI